MVHQIDMYQRNKPILNLSMSKIEGNTAESLIELVFNQFKA